MRHTACPCHKSEEVQTMGNIPIHRGLLPPFGPDPFLPFSVISEKKGKETKIHADHEHATLQIQDVQNGFAKNISAQGGDLLGAPPWSGRGTRVRAVAAPNPAEEPTGQSVSGCDQWSHDLYTTQFTQQAENLTDGEGFLGVALTHPSSDTRLTFSESSSETVSLLQRQSKDLENRNRCRL